MAVEVTLPQLGESTYEGTIGRWLKQPGDHVDRFEPLVEIVTDKVNVEMPSPYAGVLKEILVAEGETKSVGTPIAVMEVEDTAGLPAQPGAESAWPTPLPAEVEGTVGGGAPAGPPAQAVAPMPLMEGAPDGGEQPPLGAQARAGAPRLAPVPRDRTRLSPLVRRLAQEHNVPLEEVEQLEGSGAGGRVTKEDLLKYIEQGGAGRSPAPAPPLPTMEPPLPTIDEPPPPPVEPPVQIVEPSVPAMEPLVPKMEPPYPSVEPAAAVAPAPPSTMPSSPSTMTPAERIAESYLDQDWAPTRVPPSPSRPPEPSPQPQPVAGPADRVVKLTPLRRTIAQRMAQSKREIPHAYGVIEVDLTQLMRWREAHKDEWQRQHGVNITYTAFFVRATADALRAFPIVNSSWSDQGIVVRGAVHIGIGVALDDGLTVPVIRDADQKNLAGVAQELDDLGRRAREGTLTLVDVQGGTFTITNPGVFGSIWSMPIVLPGQAAILATDAIVKRPVVREDAIAVRSIMHLGLSFDHRIFDGAVAVQFMNHIKARLEGFSGQGSVVDF